MSGNQNIEYKESWRDEYLKWICGFANAQGGKLYIGKDDSGKVFSIVFRANNNDGESLTEKTDFIQNDESLTEVLKKVLPEKDLEAMTPLIVYLENNSTISTKKAEELLNKSNSTAYRYIRKLVDVGILISDGSTNNAVYIRKN